MHPPKSAAGHEAAAGHEIEDAPVNVVVLTGIVLAAGTGIVFLLVYGIFHFMAVHPLTTAPFNPMAESGTQQTPPLPRIDEHPAIEMNQLRSQEDRVLTSYGWTDKKAGITHIPIDRAIDLQLQRGFAARKEPAKQ